MQRADCTLTTDLSLAVKELAAGGVVAAATESFFGLLVDATRSDAIDRLLVLKPRGADKGLPLILPTLESWPSVVETLPEAAWELARQFWPGPLSIALPAVRSLDPRISLDGSVAVRLPPSCSAGELARLLGRPLTATSANPPGEPPATRAAQVQHCFQNAARALLIVEGESPGGKPSTVIQFEHGVWRVAREGAIPQSALIQLLGPPQSETRA